MKDRYARTVHGSHADTLQRTQPNRWAKFIKCICSALVIAATTASMCQASELESIEKRLEKAPNWIEDRAEVGYIALRCGILLFAVAQVFLSDPRRIENIVNQGERVQEAGRNLLDQGARISRSTGLGDQIINLRVEQLSKSYGESLVHNRAFHNDIFKGVIGEDFQFCQRII